MKRDTSRYYSSDDLRNVLRLTAHQYTMWTRFLIVSKAAGLNDQEVLENRLYQVARDFSSILLIYFRKSDADKIDLLFRDYIKLTIQLIDTLLYGLSSDSTKMIGDVWNKGEELIDALIAINPHWNRNLLTSALSNLLFMTVDEINKRKTNQYALDVYQYDFIEYQVLVIADLLWKGLLEKFY